MIVGISDTHAAIWRLFANPRLSRVAESFIAEAEAQGNQIGLSTISLVETMCLQEKGRIPSNTLSLLLTQLDAPTSNLVEVPLDRSMLAALPSIPRVAVPDIPDRIIAATALALGVPIISRDGKIRVAGLQTIGGAGRTAKCPRPPS